MKRWLWVAAGLTGLALVLRVGLRFPWHETGEALAGVNGWLLLAALLVNLASPVAKAWGWHLLLGGVAPNRWWVAQEANLVGTAVNIVGVGVSGEVARVSLLKQRDGVPWRAGILSVVAARIVEALGLALFVVLAPSLLPLPAALRGLQIGAAVLLLTVFLMPRLRVWERLLPRLPRGLRAGATELAAMGGGGGRRRLLAPTALAMLNWAAQWASYHLVLEAVHIHAPAGASFTALIAVNLGGIVRVTPANVGVMQAAMAGALLPFGVAAEQGVAAALALQAIQVIPILAGGIAIAGRSGWRRLLAEERGMARAA
jgi:uncharacterized membrane protein YbhN (UPF0104 family)